jgi:hypothetical protein
MRPRHVYAALCVLGTLLPYSQLVPFLLEHGLDLRLLLQQLVASRISTFFALDVVVSALVLFVLVAVEGRRAGVARPWIPVAACLTVGVSLGLPLFLYMREARLEATSP